MKIRYVGPHDAVEVPSDTETFVCERGHLVELPDDLAKSLLKQDTWEPDKKKESK